MMRRFRGVRKAENLVVAACAVAIAAAFAGGYFAEKHRAADPSLRQRPIEVTGGGYRSSDTCRACHPSQYASWHASYHRTMTQVATP